MPIIDELITLLGFDADTSGGDKFEKSLDKVKKAAAFAGKSILAAEAAVLAYTNAVASSTDELGKFGNSFGEDIERLQEWEFATERAGGKASDLRGDIASLTKTLASPIPGEFNQALAALGITVFDSSGKLKSGGDVLDELISKFEGLDAHQRQILATNVGLSESTLRFISQGREEINRLSKLARDLGGVIPEEATKTAAEYADRMTDVKLLIGGVGRSIAISLLPGLTRSLWGFEQWGIANKELISQGLGIVIEGIGRGFEIVFDTIKGGIDLVAQFIPELNGMNEELDWAQVIAVGFATAIGAIAVAFAPAIATALETAAAIGAIALVIDDLVAFSQGKKSLFGSFLDSFLEKFPQAENVINRIKKLLTDFIDGIGPLFIGLGITIKNMWEDAGNSSTIVYEAVNLIIRAFDNALAAIQGVVNLITILIALFSGDFKTAGQIVRESLGGAFEFVKGNISATYDFVSRLIDKVVEFIGIWGDLVDSVNVEEIGAKIDELGGAAVEATKGFIDEQSKNLSEAGEAIGAAASAAKQGIGSFVDSQVEGLSRAGLVIGEAASSLFGAGNAQAAESKVNNIFKTGEIKKGSTAQFRSPSDLIAENRLKAQTVPISIAGGKTVNNQGGSLSQTNNNTYNINGAQNPQVIANQISRTQARQQTELSNAAQFGAFQGIE